MEYLGGGSALDLVSKNLSSYRNKRRGKFRFRKRSDTSFTPV